MRFHVRLIGGVAFLLAGLGLAGAAHADGAAVYASRCAMCHRPDGAGAPGLFPRLNGRVAQIAASGAGRALLGKVVLAGMIGPITVDGKAINGAMPPMSSLGDQDIADLLNHLVAMNKVGKPAPFTAAEIARVRAGKPSAAAVGAERNALAAKGVVR